VQISRSEEMAKLLIIGLLVILATLYVNAKYNKLAITDIRWQVENAQYTYNRNLDRIFSIGYLQPWSPQFNESLDKLMESFCSVNDFISWNSFFGELTTITSLSETKAKYADLAINLFQNASRHIVTNQIVIPYEGNDGRLRALFNASSSQLSFAKQSDGTYIATQGWGYYHNTWLQLSEVDEKWCMQKFFADTIVFMNRPDDQLIYFVTDANIL